MAGVKPLRCLPPKIERRSAREQSQAAVAVTGLQVERGAPGRPVAETRDASLFPCRPFRFRPDRPLPGDHLQDHRRTGGGPAALGAALGHVRRAGAAGDAAERQHGAALFRHQRAHPVGRRVQHGFSGQSWLTFRQALALGGHIRRGERGTAVVFADRFIPDQERERARERGDDPRTVPFLKRFTVFNTDQCEDLPEAVTTAAPPVPEGLILPAVEALIRASGADLRIGGGRAYYDVIGDFVRVPPPQAYFEPVNWHRTVLHEPGHNAVTGVMPHGTEMRGRPRDAASRIRHNPRCSNTLEHHDHGR